jgi:hypothetical protein
MALNYKNIQKIEDPGELLEFLSKNRNLEENSDIR